MSGNFVALRTWDVLDIKYGRDYKPYFAGFTQRNYLNTKDTYLFIFGQGQENIMDVFLRDAANYNIRILHVSKKAINTMSGHGTYPRNTLVVFEYDGEKK